MVKLRDYCLNPHHGTGKHKARVFWSALNMTRGTEDTLLLRQELLRAAIECEATLGIADEYGRRYIVDFEMVRFGRKAMIRSAWIIRTGETTPRLTTCFVL